MYSSQINSFLKCPQGREGEKGRGVRTAQGEEHREIIREILRPGSEN